MKIIDAFMSGRRMYSDGSEVTLAQPGDGPVMICDASLGVLSLEASAGSISAIDDFRDLVRMREMFGVSDCGDWRCVKSKYGVHPWNWLVIPIEHRHDDHSPTIWCSDEEADMAMLLGLSVLKTFTLSGVHHERTGSDCYITVTCPATAVVHAGIEPATGSGV